MTMNVFACANNTHIHASVYVSCMGACLFIESKVWVALFNRKTWNGSCLNSTIAYHILCICYRWRTDGWWWNSVQHTYICMSMRFVICWRWKYFFSSLLLLRLLLLPLFLLLLVRIFNGIQIVLRLLIAKPSRSKSNHAYTHAHTEMKILFASVDEFQYCEWVSQWMYNVCMCVCVCSFSA